MGFDLCGVMCWHGMGWNGAGLEQIVVAVGVVAVPSGLIANGFSQVLEERRNEKHAKRRAAAVQLQRQVRFFRLYRVSSDRLYMVCVCVFIKLHITAQSGPVILVLLCHSHSSHRGV